MKQKAPTPAPRKIGDVWQESSRNEPWRVQCEDCQLGFKTEDQARAFTTRYLKTIEK